LHPCLRLPLYLALFVSLASSLSMSVSSVRRRPSLDLLLSLSLSLVLLAVRRMALKAKQAHEASQVRAREALAVGNMVAARTHAEAAIRQKGEAMQYLRLAAQVDGVQSRATAAIASQQAVGYVADATAALEHALPPGEMERVAQTMGAFGERVEQLDMTGRVMDGALAEATASSAPVDQVDDLVRRIAAENHIETAGLLPAAPVARPVAYATPQLYQQQQQYAPQGAYPPRTMYPGQAPP
jgi:charged multivesicular body protein 1